MFTTLTPYNTSGYMSIWFSFRAAKIAIKYYIVCIFSKIN